MSCPSDLNKGCITLKHYKRDSQVLLLQESDLDIKCQLNTEPRLVLVPKLKQLRNVSMHSG